MLPPSNVVSRLKHGILATRFRPSGMGQINCCSEVNDKRKSSTITPIPPRSENLRPAIRRISKTTRSFPIPMLSSGSL